MNKINILPIFRDHFSTFTDANGEPLRRDYILFIAFPLFAGVCLASVVNGPVAGFINFMLLATSIFIPLLFNVLFVIYGIRQKAPDRPEDETQARRHDTAMALLDHLYKNILHAIAVSCLLIAVLGTLTTVGLPPPRNVPYWAEEGLVMINPVWRWTLSTLAYSFAIHISLTILMIIKRSRVLLIYTASHDAGGHSGK